MSQTKRFPYRLRVCFPANIPKLLQLVSHARDMDYSALIREYVFRGLARDIERLGIHLEEDPK